MAGLSLSTWKPSSSAIFAGGKVHVVRRDDGDEIHALVRGQRGFRLDHLLEAAVARAPAARKKSAPEALDFSGSEENAPQTSSIWPSILAAMRWTAPMKAPRPPPTMP